MLAGYYFPKGRTRIFVKEGRVELLSRRRTLCQQHGLAKSKGYAKIVRNFLVCPQCDSANFLS
jgi:hypothetical protein